MKRILILSIMLCLLLSVVTLASDIDLTTLSDDDLIELKLKVEAEMDTRKLDSDKYSEIQIGTYKVGEDIKAGTYIFTGPVELDFDTNTICGQVARYNNMEDQANHENGTYDKVEPGRPVRITLEDGTIVLIQNQILGIREADPLPFAP